MKISSEEIVIEKAKSKSIKYYQSISRKFDLNSWFVYAISSGIHVFKDQFVFVDKMGKNKT